eukprot:3887388-Prymnesium_polylepis.2
MPRKALLLRPQLSQRNIAAVALSSCGEWIAVADTATRLFRLVAPEADSAHAAVRRVAAPSEALPAACAAFSPDSRLLLLGTLAGLVQVAARARARVRGSSPLYSADQRRSVCSAAHTRHASPSAAKSRAARALTLARRTSPPRQAITIEPDGTVGPTVHTMRGRPADSGDGAAAIVRIAVSDDAQWLAAADTRAPRPFEPGQHPKPLPALPPPTPTARVSYYNHTNPRRPPFAPSLPPFVYAPVVQRPFHSGQGRTLFH